MVKASKKTTEILAEGVKGIMGKSALRDRILKSSKLEGTALISESKFFQAKDEVSTIVPMINVALSGRLDGGLTPGHTMIAGPSKHFKTGFGLLLVSAYLKKNPDAVVVLYDTEFGSPKSYFEAYDIPTDQVVHKPVTSIEEMKHDLVNLVRDVQRGEKVLIFIDSIGNAASQKEIDDAMSGESKADFTRAKALKSLFRMITPYLNIKDIPLVSINHTYKTMEMYSRDVVGGGTGSYYSADNIWIVGRQQDKDGKDLTGFNFIINIEKSRYVQEKSKIPINVSFKSGIFRWSGLFDVALESGMIRTEKQGWYLVGNASVGKRRDEIEFDSKFWEGMIVDDEFKSHIEAKYRLSIDKILEKEDEAMAAPAALVEEED